MPHLPEHVGRCRTDLARLIGLTWFSVLLPDRFEVIPLNFAAMRCMRCGIFCTLFTSVYAHVTPIPSAFPNSQHLMFETVKEDVEGIEMQVTSGAFPTWLQGTKYNNGFGKFENCPADRDCFSINHLADVMSYYSKVEVRKR